MVGIDAQPEQIKIDDELVLIKYYDDFEKTLSWYQDKEVCKMVDNCDEVYDLAKLKAMYSYLNSHGECYYIQFIENEAVELVGDITLYDGEIAVVVCKEYQNRKIGKRAVKAMLSRAKQLGLEKVYANIYEFNEKSKALFLSLGFTKISKERYVCFL